MQNIHDILIQNGIPPTWVDKKAEMLFSRWLEEAESSVLASFDLALKNAKTQINAISKDLQRIITDCQGITESAIDALDGALKLFSGDSMGFLADNRVLTRSHLRLLDRLITLHNAIPQVLDALTAVESKNEKTLLSQSFVAEMTLRHIALKMTDKEQLRLLEYGQYIRDPLPGEQIATHIQALRGFVVEGAALLAHGINASSDVITAINKNRAAPTEYANLLRRLMLGLHDIGQKISTEKSEVQLCRNI